MQGGARVLGVGNVPWAVWDTATGKEVASAGTTKGLCAVSAVAEDGSLVAFRQHDLQLIGLSLRPGGPPPKVRLVEPITGRDCGEMDAIGSITCLSPWVDVLACQDVQGVQLVELRSGRQVAKLACGPDVTSLAWCGRTGRLAIALADHSISVWDTLSPRELVRFRGHQDVVSGLAFSPDGKLLASASRDTTVMVWSLKGVGLPSAGGAPEVRSLPGIWDALAAKEPAKAYRAVRHWLPVATRWSRFLAGESARAAQVTRRRFGP